MARTFNGTSDLLRNAGTAVLNGPPATMWARARPSSIDVSEHEICGLSNSANSDPLFRLGMDVAGKAFCQYRNASTNNATSTTTLSTTAYNSVAGTINASGHCEVFVNGTSEGTATAAVSTSVSLDITEIGVLYRTSPAQFWLGDIAEVAYWSVVLSAGEIRALAAGVPPWRIRRSALAGYYPLINSANERNYAQNAVHLTATGTSLVKHPPVVPMFGIEESAFFGAASSGASVGLITQMLHYYS